MTVRQIGRSVVGMDLIVILITSAAAESVTASPLV
jgi:hypothetical protein